MDKGKKVEYQKQLVKFFAGEISDNEMELLKSWLEAETENRNFFNEENELWQEASIKTNFDPYKTDIAWIELSSRLNLGNTKNESVKILKKSNFHILFAAAVLACLVACGSLVLWMTGKISLNWMSSASTLIATNEGERAHIFLADSTEIFLNSGSSIQYNGDYNVNDRIVKFTGEAFFDVRTNPAKPFVVQLEEMRVTATGTRFNIFSFSNENQAEATLEKGSIQVTITGSEPINLIPGQQVVYFIKSKKLLIREVNTNTYSAWKENKLRFIDAPMEEVLRRIGRKYNVNFEISDYNLLNLKFTATFIDESIQEVMQMLSAVSPITYRICYRTSFDDKEYQKPKIVLGLE